VSRERQKGYTARPLVVGNNYNNGLNGNNNYNNNARLFGITQVHTRNVFMKTYKNLWQGLCSYENLEKAFEKARKGKTFKPYVVQFEKDLDKNLNQLRIELLFHAYSPRSLKTFIIHDPKTRKISKSDFRDRVIHHALCNIIEPIFESHFIYDSYANRIGKGTLKALERFDYFKRKVFNKRTQEGYVLKADIKHYFDEVDRTVLLEIIKDKIGDPKVLWLIKKILLNYKSKNNKGMPLGNLTSQFFANVYLNELDHFVKHGLKVKYYLRYVDDFVILHRNRGVLSEYKIAINVFLREKLSLELHPEKSKLISIKEGITFLGFRVFYYHKLLKKANIIKMAGKIERFKLLYDDGCIDYDTIYVSMQGWMGYAKYGNTFNLRRKIIQKIESYFPKEISTVEMNRYLRNAS